jgi:hypothetical protein
MADKKCDCDEPGCVFTKEEAEEFTELANDYYIALLSDKPSQELNDEQQFIREQMCFSRPPFFTDSEWKRALAKNTERGKVPQSMKNQLLEGFSAVHSTKINKKKE